LFENVDAQAVDASLADLARITERPVRLRKRSAS
jgi:hypothetical protein